jgi:hypothetical protein
MMPLSQKFGSTSGSASMTASTQIVSAQCVLDIMAISPASP